MKKFIGLIVVAIPLLAGGADQPDPKTRAEQIAPWYGEQALAVVYCDLAQVNAGSETIFALVKKMGLSDKDMAPGKAVFQEIVGGLTRAGVKAIYGIDLLDRPDRPLVVVPAEGTDKAAVMKILGKIPEAKVEERGNYLLASHPEILKRLDKSKRDPAELTRAFATSEGMAAQLVFLPPVHLRKAILETMPRLPKDLGGGPTTDLDRGLRWATLNIKLALQPSVSLVVQSQDAAAAKVMARIWSLALDAIAKEAQVHNEFPGLDQLLPLAKPRIEGDRLVVTLNNRDIEQILIPVAAKMRANAARVEAMNNMTQIAIAMQGYHDVYKAFPAPNSYNAQGKPLLSWRVHILPFVEQQPLYQEFKLDEPWDSPHNKKLIARMPAVYRTRGQKNADEGKTCFQLPVGKGFISDGPKGRKFSDIFDGTSNTIMVLQTNDDAAVTWTKPDDWTCNPKNPVQTLTRPGQNRFMAGFADGSVRYLPLNLKSDTLRALLTRSGGESVDVP